MTVTVQPDPNNSGPGTECGSGTVLTVLLVLLATCLLTVGVALSQANLAAQRAQSAADAGALTAAGRFLGHRTGTCAAAAKLVARHGAQLVTCQQHGPDRMRVTVTAAVPVLGRTFTVTRQAIAGVSD